MVPSESQVMSCSVPFRIGGSVSRWIGMIGKSWSMAQLSGSDWKSEKLQKYRSTSVPSMSPWRSAKVVLSSPIALATAFTVQR